MLRRVARWRVGVSDWLTLCSFAAGFLALRPDRSLAVLFALTGVVTATLIVWPLTLDEGCIVLGVLALAALFTGRLADKLTLIAIVVVAINAFVVGRTTYTDMVYKRVLKDGRQDMLAAIVNGSATGTGFCERPGSFRIGLPPHDAYHAGYLHGLRDAWNQHGNSRASSGS